MLTPEQAEKLNTSSEWKALKEHIQESIEAIDSASAIPDGDDHDKAARGRKHAVEIMRRILEPFQIDVTPNYDKKKEQLKKLGIE